MKHNVKNAIKITIPILLPFHAHGTDAIAILAVVVLCSRQAIEHRHLLQQIHDSMAIFPVSYLFLFWTDDNGYNFTAITVNNCYSLLQIAWVCITCESNADFFMDGEPASLGIFPVSHCFVFRVDDNRCYFVIITNTHLLSIVIEYNMKSVSLGKVIQVFIEQFFHFRRHFSCFTSFAFHTDSNGYMFVAEKWTLT